MEKTNYWEVIGRDSLKEIFNQKYPAEYFYKQEMKSALKALVSKASLSYDEILESYTEEESGIHKRLLEVRESSDPHYTLECGTNPYFTARLVEE